MEVIILMAWTIWRSRNDLIFRQVNPSILLALQNFKVELQILLLMAKRSYFPGLDQWIANLNQLGCLQCLYCFSQFPFLYLNCPLVLLLLVLFAALYLYCSCSLSINAVGVQIPIVSLKKTNQTEQCFVLFFQRSERSLRALGKPHNVDARQ